MTEKELTPWGTLDQHSWNQEREELIADERRRLENGELEKDEYGYRKVESHVPLSEVIRFAKFARNHEEYWAALVKINEWWQKNPEYDGVEIAHFRSSFIDCYCMRNDLPYPARYFMVASRVLQSILAGRIPDDLDSSEVKEFLLEDPYVKDVN